MRRIESGFDLMADELDLVTEVEAADLVVTGEGFIDDASFDGKVVGGVLDLASEFDVPVLAVAGACAIVGFVAGAICGALFSLLLAAFQRRGRLETLSLLCVGLLGALATGWLGLLYGDAFFAPALAATTSLPLALASLALSSALLGGVSAAVTLHLARRAPRTLAAPDPRRLDA